MRRFILLLFIFLISNLYSEKFYLITEQDLTDLQHLNTVIGVISRVDSKFLPNYQKSKLQEIHTDIKNIIDVTSQAENITYYKTNWSSEALTIMKKENEKLTIFEELSLLRGKISLLEMRIIQLESKK